MTRMIYGLCALALILATIFGFLGFLHPAFDTAAHFRWHLGLALLGWAIIGLLLRVARVPIVVLFFAAMAIWQSNAGNRHTLDSSPPKAEGAATWTMLTFNLRFNNRQKENVLAQFAEMDPDILALTETSRPWAAVLDQLKSGYPYKFHCPEWSALGGSMIFSRLPLRSDSDYCHAYAALGLTQVKIEDRWIDIGITHLRWPWPASGPEQVTALEPRLSELGPDGIISGDFNATTWSHELNRFANFAGMDIVTGFGGTWMWARLPVWLAPLLGFPIDNVMIKGDVVTTKVETLPSHGSDHLPLWIEFTLRPARQ